MQSQHERQADLGHHQTAPHGESDDLAQPTLQPPDLEWVAVNNPPSLLGGHHSNRDSTPRHAHPAEPSSVIPPGATTTTSQLATIDAQISAQHEALQKAIASFLNRSRRLSSLRREVLWQRSRTKSEWQDYARNREFMQESQAEFLSVIKAVEVALPPASWVDSLSKADKNLSRDHERLNKKTQAAWDMETRLEKLESKLQRLENKVNGDIKIISGMLKQTTGHREIEPAAFPDAEPSSSTPGATDVEIPPLLQHYFDKIADMKLERDNLIDLDQQHQEEKVSRQILQDQGESPHPSDESFEDSWLQTFAEAEVAFVEASKKAERARQYCINEGMDPEAYRENLARSPQHELYASLPAGSPVADFSPPQYALGRREDIKTPSEHLFFFDEGRGPDLLDATDPFMSPPRPLPDRNMEGLQRVATWVDLLNAEPDQTERIRDEISPTAMWDDDQQEPHASGLISQINVAEHIGRHPLLRQPDTRSRSVSLSEVSPRPSTVEIGKSSRRRGSKPTHQYNPSEKQVPSIPQGEGGVASPPVTKRSSTESTWF